ncbi:ribonuclease H-like domain-containing protein [Mycena rebaudengoi]|nr:ribonuclease H-like domain-containing protein [Mycena rebaudengoi]
MTMWDQSAGHENAASLQRVETPTMALMNKEEVIRKAASAENTTPSLTATAKATEQQTTKSAATLPALPRDYTVHYLTTEDAANEAMATILDGVVGFDTEFMARRPSPEEAILEDLFGVSGNKKAALLGWQMIELSRNPNYVIQWDLTGLCVVQIARGDVAWVMDLTRMRAFPRELKRVLTSLDITKTGVGLVSDIPVIWNDTRTEINNLVDAGLMAKLLYCEKYSDSGYNNLSMTVSVAEVLGAYIPKDLRLSDWSIDLTPEQIQYAGLDAIASLQLYNKLTLALDEKATSIGQDIPEDWYSFNSARGEPTRVGLSCKGEELPWSPRICPWFFLGKFQGYYQ